MSQKSAKNKNNNICAGCLSVDRKLTSLTDHLTLYYTLLGQDSSVTTRKSIKMCWECTALLRSVQRFQTRVVQAHSYLSTKVERTVPQYECQMLSPLVAVVKTNNDFEIEHEETVDKVDMKTETTIKLEPDMAIKNEDSGEYDDDHLFYDLKDELMDTAELDPGLFAEEIVLKRVKKKEEPNISEDQDNCMIDKRGRKFNYRIITPEVEGDDTSKYIKTVPIDHEEALYWIAKDKEAKEKLTGKVVCQLCYRCHWNQERLDAHVRKKHHESAGQFLCPLCAVRFRSAARLASHTREHYSKHACLLCAHESYEQRHVLDHYRRAHVRVVQCVKCHATFDKVTDYHRHDKESHRRLRCDHCGNGFALKSRLRKHIIRKHMPLVCKICNVTYSDYFTLSRHRLVQHSRRPTEEAYCVECDIQFDNKYKFESHLKYSSKHNTTKYACAECGKEYKKKSAMKYHYQLAHLKHSNYYCEQCQRYFLNPYRLRQHIASFHDHIRMPKTKICPHCGRAFQTNRILENHIRTHTGERPFSCALCAASFGQKTALVSHTKSIHRKTISYSEAGDK